MMGPLIVVHEHEYLHQVFEKQRNGFELMENSGTVVPVVNGLLHSC